MATGVISSATGVAVEPLQAERSKETRKRKENNLRINIYGEKGSLAWEQMEPNTLTARWLDKPMQIFRTGDGPLYPQAHVHTRIPAGHPEGYLEAFANIYRNIAYCIQARLSNQSIDPLYTDFPTIEDGVRGMEFIEAVVRSGTQDEVKWVKVSSE